MANAGRVRPVHKGTWSAKSAYDVLNIVVSADASASYIAVNDVPAGADISNEAYWALLVKAPKAASGASGSSGFVHRFDAAEMSSQNSWQLSSDVFANAYDAFYAGNRCVVYFDINAEDGSQSIMLEATVCTGSNIDFYGSYKDGDTILTTFIINIYKNGSAILSTM